MWERQFGYCQTLCEVRKFVAAAEQNMQSNFQSNDGNMGNMVRTKSNGLFRNAGAKLKILALVFFVIDILIGVALGVTCFIIGADSYEGYIFIIIGIAAILISPLIGWLNAIMIYAFGELCENVYDIRNQKR